MSAPVQELLPARSCGIATALDIVGDRWSLLIVREVWRGHCRFSEIVEQIGAPRDRVAARLKHLVATGVLDRVPYQDAPTRYEYTLTESGEELTQVLMLLFDWGKRWGHADDHVELWHNDHRLAPRLICAECDQPVDSENVRRVKTGGDVNARS